MTNQSPDPWYLDPLAWFWLSLIPLALALPCFFGYTWAEGDLIRQFHPWKELGRQAVAAGHLPLWNPYVYCGMPLLGNFQSGLAYPLHLPFYFFDFAPALGWHLGIHFLLSGLGFYALARALDMDRGPALLAALAWQCNAFLFARVEFMSALSAYAWTPWILWATVTRKHWSITASFVGLMALAGYPLELAYSLLAGIVMLAVLRAAKIDLGHWALGWLVGLLAGAVVLIPGTELLLHSSRLGGSADALVSDLLPLSLSWHLIWPAPHQPWPLMFSIGLPTLGLSLFARGPAAKIGLLLTIIGLSLSFGLGAHLLPNRHPTLALILAAEGLALLTGAGAQRLWQPVSPAFIYPLCAIALLIPSAWHWTSRGDLASAHIYDPARSASYLATRLDPNRRFLLAPTVQTERDRVGNSVTDANQKFAEWLQSNTASPLHLHDANGYDPLAPATIVSLLNETCFPNFINRPDLADLMGVEATADWDPKEGRFTAAIQKRQSTPFRAAVLETGSLPDLKALLSLPPRLRADVKETNPGTLEITLPVSKGGLLILNDSYYPGWKAEVDGKPAPIEQAFGAFRGVNVDASAKQLTLRYRPWSFMIGGLLSLLAWLLLGLSVLKQKINGSHLI